VEDLFFNVPIRRKAMRTGGEEYQKCVEVMTRYAIHFAGIAFTYVTWRNAKYDVQVEIPCQVHECVF
jgi:DNA mismatch repair protein MLH1